jgi:hypothetical protein
MLSVVWRYAQREHLVRPDADDVENQMLSHRLTPALGLYVFLIALGLLVPIAAEVGYFALAVYLIVPFAHRRAERR